MRPIDQSSIEPGAGNSLAACLASILEMPIEEVPDFQMGQDVDGLDSFLDQKGLAGAWLIGDLSLFLIRPFCQEHVVIIGPSPRNPSRWHAVVGACRAKEDALEIVHDPHPSRAGLLDPFVGALLIFPRSALKLK